MTNSLPLPNLEVGYKRVFPNSLATCCKPPELTCPLPGMHTVQVYMRRTVQYWGGRSVPVLVSSIS